MLLRDSFLCVTLLVSFKIVNVSEACLQCICETASGCLKNPACYGTEQSCGLFAITEPYWADALSPRKDPNSSLSTELQFQECAFDISCAKRTVRQYMEETRRDCNGDGVINCDDYVAIHMLGAEDCSQFTMQVLNMQRYKQCKERISVRNSVRQEGKKRR